MEDFARRAALVCSWLKEDGDGWLLSGDRSVPFVLFREPPEAVDGLMRVVRNPVMMGGRTVKASRSRRCLSLNRIPVASVTDRDLIALTELAVRRKMRVHIRYRLLARGKQGRLLVPPPGGLGELSRIIRVRGTMPEYRELRVQYEAEAEYAAMGADAPVALEFGDSRHPAPPFFADKPFAIFQCRIVKEYHPGARHVPLVSLIAPDTSSIASATPGRGPFRMLNALPPDAVLRAALISVLPENGRKPRLLLRARPLRRK